MFVTRRGTLVAFLLLPAILAFPERTARAQSPIEAQGSAAALWPHATTFDGTTVTVYQPQAISWPDHAQLTARAAVAISRKGETPILGVVELTMKTTTDAGTEMVQLSDPTLVTSHFPSLDTNAAADLEGKIRAHLPSLQLRPVPLQSVLLSLKDKPAGQDVTVDNNPPVIFTSNKPASLVVFDGDPVMAPVGKSGLKVAVNTNWDVFTDGNRWFLLNDGLWLAASAFSGPYAPVSTLPPAFSSIPADPNYAEVRKALPPKPDKPPVVPAVFVSTKPAEMIVTNGAPQFEPVQGTALQVVKNTGSALFFYPPTGTFYFLASGRWFASTGLAGPWHFASNELPPDFAAIPPDGKLAGVLPSVPGTSQAELAVLQAQVPQQATLKKDAAKVAVAYAGEPKFEPITGTPMTYGVNTSYQVIQASGTYYVCYQGAWFTGPTPTGPWVLAASVPQVIYTIPPSSPMYNVTYVKIYASTPATVTYGVTAGYAMGFVSAGLLVYGTGYYYPPAVYPGPVPVYYPRPYTYGGSTWYNPTTGAWARGGAVYGPNYGARGSSYYNPGTGAYARGGSVYGPYGGAGAFSAYNPSNGSYARGSASWNSAGGVANANYYNARTGVSGSTNQNWNPYSRWGSSTFAGPNGSANTVSASNARGSVGGFNASNGAQGAGYSSARGRGGAVKTQGGDVYAGHDGNVYQHSSSGWSKYSNGGWQPVTPPANANQARTSANTEATQRSSQANTTTPRQPSPRQQTYGAQRQQLDSTSFNQLEQDRHARGFGGSGFGEARGGGSREGFGQWRR